MFDNLACQCQKTLESERNAREHADKQVLELLRDVKDRYQIKLSAYKRATTDEAETSKWGEESAQASSSKGKDKKSSANSKGGWGDESAPTTSGNGWGDESTPAAPSNGWGDEATPVDNDGGWDNDPTPAAPNADSDNQPPADSNAAWGDNSAPSTSGNCWDKESTPSAPNKGWGEESAPAEKQNDWGEDATSPASNRQKKKNKGKKGDEKSIPTSNEKANQTSKEKVNPPTKEKQNTTPKEKPNPISHDKTNITPDDKAKPTLIDKACGPDEVDRFDSQEIKSQLLTAKLDLRLMEREKSRITVERDDLLKQVEDLKKRNEKIERELTHSKNMVKTLKDGCALVEDQVKTYEVRHDTAVMSKADMERELIAIKEESSRHITTINNLQKSNEQISKAFVQSVTAHDDLKAEFSRRLEDYKMENMRLAEANNQLRKCVDFLQKKL